ncbi:hypothetical protein JQC67_18015 [Aurantibacter crassamenti]|uniref:DUF6702 family protein n=1 Tax=Aurantibacter crassamenti TaxID=1837375 RepID=UPI00193A827F|nr:DUF6702 family protein [Aurantibacter crassamenti]MBM1108053.1 hypothetical protein [Aurantibacter crassamenti]
MKVFKRGLIILLLPLFSFTVIHKFYVSVTNVTYSEKYSSIQITSRIFIDDLEALLKERYGLDAKLATENESDAAAAYIQKYFREKFIVEINGDLNEYQFLGKKYDNDVAILYIEVTNIELTKLQSISIQNKLLTDLFDEQQNILHFKINDKKKSFVLMKDNDKGMLKL